MTSLLTVEEEIKNIKKDFINIIKSSQQLKIDNKEFNIDPLFNQWYEAKRKFIKRFNIQVPQTEGSSNFIYEFPEMTFSLDVSTKISKVEGFIDFIDEYLWCPEIPENLRTNFCNFLKANKSGFFENKVVTSWHTIYDEVIQEGMKLLKSFKFFFKGPLLEDIQTKASMIIQENSITGKLCVSVHPLDFLSASETTYDWRSCHALDGDYRSGNMAYMVDDCTVMCYLKTENNMVLPRFPEEVKWNSKKWRMYLFLAQEEKVVWAGRQYPYESKSLLNTVQEKIFPIITGWPLYSNMWYGRHYNFTDWSNYEYSPQGSTVKYVNINGYLFDKKSVITGNNQLFYNDLLYSTKYFPSYSYRTKLTSSIRLEDTLENRSNLRAIHLGVGDRPYCPCCGRRTVEFSDEMVCVSCDENYGTQENEEFTFCSRCGTRIWKDDAFWDEDGEYYCSDCWDEEKREDINY